MKDVIAGGLSSAVGYAAAGALASWVFPPESVFFGGLIAVAAWSIALAIYSYITITKGE